MALNGAPDYRWLSVSSRSGRVLADLPGLVCSSVGAVLGGETVTSASLPLFDRCPERWWEAVAEVAACLVLVDAADDGRPVWGGPVIKSDKNESDTVALSLASWEWFLRGFYVGGREFTGVPQTQVVATLLAEFVQDGTHPLVVEAASSGTLRDRTYADADDKPAIDVLSELMDVQGGPEWTVGWRHLSDPERYVPVMRVADRVGVSPQNGLGPGATFDMPGAVTAFSLTTSWASGDGATSVVATSNPDPSDQDAPRPQSPPQVVDDPLRPTVQHRWTPSTSITDTATLVSHAVARLAIMRGGARALSLTAHTADAHRLGRTWRIGDDVGYAIDAPSVPEGLTGMARALGWVLDLDASTVTPVLGVPS